MISLHNYSFIIMSYDAALKAKQPLCDLKDVISSDHNRLLGPLNCPKTYLVGISVQNMFSRVRWLGAPEV